MNKVRIKVNYQLGALKHEIKWRAEASETEAVLMREAAHEITRAAEKALPAPSKEELRKWISTKLIDVARPQPDDFYVALVDEFAGPATATVARAWTLGEMMERDLDEMEKRLALGEISASTLDVYTRACHYARRLSIWNHPLEALVPASFTAAYDEARALTGKLALSENQLIKVRSRFTSALNLAVYESALASSPHQFVRRAPVEVAGSQVGKAIPIGDLLDLLDAAHSYDGGTNVGGVNGSRAGLFLPTLVGMYLGARPGELLAIAWSSVNLETGEIEIKEKLEKARKQGECQTISPALKSKAGYRTLVVPQDVIDWLKIERDHQQEIVARFVEAGTPLPAHKFSRVFSDPDGEVVSLYTVSQAWATLAEKVLGRRVTLGHLRHTNLSYVAHTSGIDAAKEQGGHSGIAITSRYYASALPTAARETSNRLDSFISKEREARVERRRRDFRVVNKPG